MRPRLAGDFVSTGTQLASLTTFDGLPPAVEKRRPIRCVPKSFCGDTRLTVGPICRS